MRWRWQLALLCILIKCHSAPTLSLSALGTNRSLMATMAGCHCYFYFYAHEPTIGFFLACSLTLLAQLFLLLLLHAAIASTAFAFLATHHSYDIAHVMLLLLAACCHLPKTKSYHYHHHSYHIATTTTTTYYPTASLLIAAPPDQAIATTTSSSTTHNHQP